MTRLEAPPGTVTRAVALRILRREGILTSAAMLLKLKGVTRIVPEGRTHGFYHQEPLLKIINDRRKLKGIPPLESLFDEEHKIGLRQATREDIYRTYDVAVRLFGPTTPAIERIPLFEKCAEGNLVVTDHGQVVGFAVILPMKQEPLKEFLAGKFRGSQITADHLDPFATGKVVDVLVKSIGSHHEHIPTCRKYNQRLLSGLRDEMSNWGRKGYIIRKIYCTSEESDGIALALEIRMQSLGKIPGSRGKKRYAFELDPYLSTHPIIKSYAQSIDQWKEQHPKEWENAWNKWKAQHS